jgi:hypothetical protein
MAAMMKGTAGHRGRDVWRHAAVAIIVMVMAGCDATPSPAPHTPPPSAPVSTAAVPNPTPEASTTSGTIEQPDRPPTTTAAQKIRDALAAGTIDEPTSLLYRVFALFGDARLPEEYRGEPEHDRSAVASAHDVFDELPPAIQDQIAPYLLRPSDPASAWSTEPPTASTGTVELAVAHPLPLATHAVSGAPACDGTWMHGQVSPNIPVMIWAQCTGDPAAAAAWWEEARGYMAIHYGPETALMGPPIGDANIPGDRYPDTPETGDGLIDIYLISAFSPSGHPRTFDYGAALAVTIATPPFIGPAGAEADSSYVVVRPGLTGLKLETTIVHEFFHVLQANYNDKGTLDCPVRSLGGCSGLTREYHWFVEASAKWSEEYFLPQGRPVLVYPFWKPFVRTGVGLADTIDLNEYMSFAWPLFMQQESGATKIADAWRAMTGKKGWRAVQAALDGALPFKDHFRDFGVRVLNRELLPGDPISPRFQDPGLDPSFPIDPPGEPRQWPVLLDDLVESMGGPRRTYQYNVPMDFMWTEYFPIEPPPRANKITWDFSAFGPEIDVDAVIRIRGTGWERRKLVQGTNEWCLEKPADAFEEGFLIFSNHDQEPRVITRPFSIVAEEAGCGTPVGTLAYSFLDTAPLVSAPGGSVAIDATVQVRLKANENIGDPYAAMYLNDGSTYGVSEHDHILAPPAPDGCQPQSNATGTPGGALEIDSVVGNTWIDENDKWRLTLGIGLPVHYETDEFWCSLGSSHSSKEGGVTYPECDGIETGSTESTQTFVFDCDFQGTSQSWSVNGTIVINR